MERFAADIHNQALLSGNPCAPGEALETSFAIHEDVWQAEMDATFTR